jgi:uncharacterized repeat protein (TIGR03803 family)
LAFDGRLYGYVPGGVHGYGVIFSMDPDGNNFTVMKDFDATNTGFDPHGGLIFTATRAYGVTSFGGTHNQGVIYSINQDGTGYEVIHNFEREEGAQPERSLVMSDSALYGVTLLGGTDESGVLFRVDTTGANYEVLHHFSGAQGSFPSGSLVSGTEALLFGTTSGGGLDNKGTVFQFNKETKEIKTLLDFSTVNAQNPTGTMVLADTILYGLALGGVGDGVLFSVKTDGTGFVKVVDKDSESAGRYGNSLELKDSIIYVSMRQGGTDDVGVLFSVKTNGENFKKLFDFSYASGAVPEGAIIVTDTLLYGMTQMGGPDGAGVAYSIHPDGTGYTPLFTFDDNAGSSSGRMKSTNGVQNTSGSVSLFNDALYATVTSTTDRTTIGTIRRYEFDTGGDEDGGGEEDAVTEITPDEEDVISVFPNPAANFVTVESPTNPHLVLMDVSGRRLVIVRSGERTIDLTRLSAGIYFLVVDGKTFRIVKN